MRRVLYLAKGGNIGGGHCQLLYLLTCLDNSYDPVVVCTSGGQIVDRLKSAGIKTEVCPLRSWRKARSAVGRYLDAERLTGLARSYNPVLVHA